MLLADVNVFVHAHRVDSNEHTADRAWVGRALVGDEPFGVSEHVLASFLRVVTHRGIFREPTPLDRALAFTEEVLAAPSVVRVRPGPRHWGLFTELCQVVGARGNATPDAFLAALAIEQGATFVTRDRGFARFPGLRWQLPTAS